MQTTAPNAIGYQDPNALAALTPTSTGTPIASLSGKDTDQEYMLPSGPFYEGKDYGPGKGMAYTMGMPPAGFKYVYGQDGNRHVVPDAWQPTTQTDGALEAYESGQDIIGSPDAVTTAAPEVTQAAPEYDIGTTEFLKRNPIPTEAPEWFTKQVEQQKQYWDPSWGPFEHESWEEMEDPAKAHMMRELGPYDEREYTNPNAVAMGPDMMGPGMMGPVGPVPPGMMGPVPPVGIAGLDPRMMTPQDNRYNMAQWNKEEMLRKGVDPRMFASYGGTARPT